MSYGIQNLRRSAVYDSLTPGSSGRWDEDDRGSFGNSYSDSDSQGPSSSVDRDAVLGPDGSPLEQKPPSGLAKLADVSVDPNKDSEQNDLKQYLDTVQGAYNPNYRSRDRNDRLLDEAPTRGQPTKSDRAIAILMSLGKDNALDIQEKVLQAPYYRGMDEFKAKSEPFYKAADLENRDNANQRQVLGSALTGYNYGRRTDATVRGGDQKYEIGMINARANKAKAEGYSMINVRPDGVYARNLAGDEIYLGESGTITKEQEIELQNTGRIRVATIGANSRIEAARIGAESRETVATTRAAGGSTGGVEKPAYDDNGNLFRWDRNTHSWVNKDGLQPEGEVHYVGTARNPAASVVDTPKERGAVEQEIMKDAIRRGLPEAKFIERGPNNTLQVKKRPDANPYWGKAEREAELREFDAFLDKLEGKTPAPPVTPPAPAGSPTSSTKPAGDGTLRARAADELRRRGKQVTQETIDEVIRRGLVK